MDRVSRKIVKDYCGLLAQIHDAIKTSLEQENTAIAMDLLGQAQEAAVQIGTIEEAAEGKGFVDIGLQERRQKVLQDYCELLYQICVLLLQEHKLNPQKVWDQLRQWHEQIRENVLEEERPEIVFLAEETRWTGAMENFWRAVDEDVDCDVYVVSIPTGENGLKTEEKEKNEYPYPDEALVVSFADYNFKERHPDILCVPFPLPDGGALPEMQQFFSGENLKSCTDLLVYITCKRESQTDVRENPHGDFAWDCADYIIADTEEKRRLLSEPEICPDMPEAERERKLLCPDETEGGETALYELLKGMLI